MARFPKSSSGRIRSAKLPTILDRGVCTMKSLLLLTLVLAASVAKSQDKVELFAGYSHYHLDSIPAGELNGWEVSGQYKFTRWLGGIADFSGDYGSVRDEANPTQTFLASTHVHSFLFGPQVSLPARVSPFGHVLGGVTHASGLNQSDNPPTLAVGGGLDVRLKPELALRAIQADFIRTYFFGAIYNYRISTGVLLRF
jgi:hypothetical protein